MHGISKKSVFKIFIILFEQDCPEAVVHDSVHNSTVMFKFLSKFFDKMVNKGVFLKINNLCSIYFIFFVRIIRDLNAE